MSNQMSFLLIVIFLSTSFVSPLIGQELSREEAREWKNMARDFRRNPAALKTLVEENDECSSSRQAAERENVQLQAGINAKDNQITSLEEQIAALNRQLLTAQNTPQPASNPSVTDVLSTSPSSDPLPTDEVLDGVVFRVQLGAFQQNRVDENLDTSNNLDLENADGMQKVIVGQFRSYESATKLRDNLQQMGVKDAFIVAYRNGSRISVQEALGQ